MEKMTVINAVIWMRQLIQYLRKIATQNKFRKTWSIKKKLFTAAAIIQQYSWLFYFFFLLFLIYMKF